MKTFSVCILAATLVGCGGAGTEFAKPASTNYADVSTIERIPVVIPKDATTDAHWIIGMGKGYDRLKFKLDLADDGRTPKAVLLEANGVTRDGAAAIVSAAMVDVQKSLSERDVKMWDASKDIIREALLAAVKSYFGLP